MGRALDSGKAEEAGSDIEFLLEGQELWHPKFSAEQQRTVSPSSPVSPPTPAPQGGVPLLAGQALAPGWLRAKDGGRKCAVRQLRQLT